MDKNAILKHLIAGFLVSAILNIGSSLNMDDYAFEFAGAIDATSEGDAQEHSWWYRLKSAPSLRRGIRSDRATNAMRSIGRCLAPIANGGWFRPIPWMGGVRFAG